MSGNHLACTTRRPGSKHGGRRPLSVPATAADPCQGRITKERKEKKQPEPNPHHEVTLSSYPAGWHTHERGGQERFGFGFYAVQR
jgi:hypothetical protein